MGQQDCFILKSRDEDLQKTWVGFHIRLSNPEEITPDLIQKGRPMAWGWRLGISKETTGIIGMLCYKLVKMTTLLSVTNQDNL